MIGGGQLYAEAISRADELLLTEVGADVEGDTFFPPWDRARVRGGVTRGARLGDRRPVLVRDVPAQGSGFSLILVLGCRLGDLRPGSG